MVDFFDSEPTDKKSALSRVRLQFITHRTEAYQYIDSARVALMGGCRWVQLRAKDVAEAVLEPLARQVKNLCRTYEATFIIDDHVEMAMLVGADGVHLGQNDMPVREARRLMGDRFIIGATANTLDDVRRHWADGADYIGCGPFRYTTTKKNLSQLLGAEGYQRICQAMRLEGIRLPIVAIGGITVSDIANVIRTGVDGIALSGAILRAKDPVAEMRRVVDSVRRAVLQRQSTVMQQ